MWYPYLRIDISSAFVWADGPQYIIVDWNYYTFEITLRVFVVVCFQFFINYIILAEYFMYSAP